GRIGWEKGRERRATKRGRQRVGSLFERSNSERTSVFCPDTKQRSSDKGDRQNRPVGEEKGVGSLYLIANSHKKIADPFSRPTRPMAREPNVVRLNTTSAHTQSS